MENKCDRYTGNFIDGQTWPLVKKYMMLLLLNGEKEKEKAHLPGVKGEAKKKNSEKMKEIVILVVVNANTAAR